MEKEHLEEIYINVEGRTTMKRQAEPFSRFGLDICVKCPIRFDCKVMIRMYRGELTGAASAILATGAIHVDDVPLGVPCLIKRGNRSYNGYDDGKYVIPNEHLLFKCLNCNSDGYYLGKEWPYG